MTKELLRQAQRLPQSSAYLEVINSHLSRGEKMPHFPKHQILFFHGETNQQRRMQIRTEQAGLDFENKRRDFWRARYG